MSLAAVIARRKGQPVTPVTRTQNTGVSAAVPGRGSRNPYNPCNPTKSRYPEKKPELANPDALLLEIARTLEADLHMLRALLSDDDLQAIAEQCPGYNRERLTDYFRQMESDGKSLQDIDWHLNTLIRQSTARNQDKASQRRKHERAWRAAHEPFINHVMGCPSCNAPRDRYCTVGADLQRAYIDTYQNGNKPQIYS